MVTSVCRALDGSYGVRNMVVFCHRYIADAIPARNGEALLVPRDAYGHPIASLCTTQAINYLDEVSVDSKECVYGFVALQPVLSLLRQ